jgi:hypothetical protein
MRIRVPICEQHREGVEQVKPLPVELCPTVDAVESGSRT